MALLVLTKTKLTRRQEGHSPIITLEEDNADHVLVILEHCNSHDYGDVRNRHWNKDSFVFDAEMLCLADKYQCKWLAQDIAVYFEKTRGQTTLSRLVKDHSLIDALDVIYGLPSGSAFLTIFRQMFREHFAGDFKGYLPSKPEFETLYKKHHMLSNDIIYMIQEHYYLQ